MTRGQGIRRGRRLLLTAGVSLCVPVATALATPSHTAGVSLQVQHRPSAAANVHVLLSHAPRLPEGGYYYAVVVLSPYKRYTRSSPPPCAPSSNMQRTDYGYPSARGMVSLYLTPARSATRHWCPGGTYSGGIYAVPHAPPCESRYPCRSEPYEPPSPCWNLEGRRVCGVVALPRQYAYPDPLPRPLASGTHVVAHFSVVFR